MSGPFREECEFIRQNPKREMGGMMEFRVVESAKQGRWAVVPAAVSMVLFCAIASATSAAQFEVPANRKAADILHTESLKGPNYQIRDTVGRCPGRC